MRAVATALASADRAEPELVADVVRTALGRAGLSLAGSVLLFLSADFAHQAHAAVLAASRAAHCLNVSGCTAAGIFTEEDWVLDRPAACAMVFGGACGLAAQAAAGAPLLSLATPSAATGGWLATGGTRFGLLSTDGSAHAPGRIWCHGKMAASGRGEAAIGPARAAVGVSRGVLILGGPHRAGTSGRDVLRLDGRPALHVLLHELPPEVRATDSPPLHLLSAGLLRGAPENALAEGRYELVPVIAVDPERGSLTLALPAGEGEQLFWALRQPAAAEADMRRLTTTLAGQLGRTPDFGLFFSCLGRGPWFFGGADRDLAVIRERFPTLPLAGAYGGGQIAPLWNGNHQIHNAAVLALFAADV